MVVEGKRVASPAMASASLLVTTKIAQHMVTQATVHKKEEIRQLRQPLPRNDGNCVGAVSQCTQLEL